MWLKGVENLPCEERLGEQGSSRLEKHWIFGFGAKVLLVSNMKPSQQSQAALCGAVWRCEAVLEQGKMSHDEGTEAGRQGAAECPEKPCSPQAWRAPRKEWIAQYNSTGYVKDGWGLQDWQDHHHSHIQAGPYLVWPLCLLIISYVPQAFFFLNFNPIWVYLEQLLLTFI